MKFSIRYILASTVLAALVSAAFAANGTRGIFLLAVLAWPMILNQAMVLSRARSFIKLTCILCSCAFAVMLLVFHMTALGGLWSTFGATLIALIVATVFWMPQILIIVIADDILNPDSSEPYEVSNET